MKTLVYTLAVNKEGREVDDAGIFTTTSKTWEHYCKRHGFDFYVIDTPPVESKTPHWFRYFIFDLKPDYDRYLYVDSDVMARWDAPNINEEFPDTDYIYAVKDNSGLGWVWESINVYKQLLGDVDVDWTEYFNSGVVLFSSKHKDLYQTFKQFYIDNKTAITEFQKQVRKGFDQTPFNYFIKSNEVPLKFMSDKFNLTHMARKEVLQGGYFINMAYFWHFNGLPRNQQQQIIEQTWNQIKDNY